MVRINDFHRPLPLNMEVFDHKALEVRLIYSRAGRLEASTMPSMPEDSGLWPLSLSVGIKQERRSPTGSAGPSSPLLFLVSCGQCVSGCVSWRRLAGSCIAKTASRALPVTNVFAGCSAVHAACVYLTNRQAFRCV